MNRYFAISGGLHLTLALLLVLLLGASKQPTNATYTIDFIGSGKVIAMQQQTAPAAAAAEAKPEAAPVTPPAPKAEEPKKPEKKAYTSKSEISTKKQKTKKKEKPAPAPLAAPSVLDEEKPADNKQESSAEGNGDEGEFEGGSIQTDFATFPYPWYITQVRNRLWSEWEKRRPTGVVRNTVVAFAIARDGSIKDLQLVKSSGDDSFDFSAKSSVINAGPFPPLPMLYEKDLLTVTLEFKQEK